MRCDNVQAQLSALLDGELSPSVRAAILRHVEACGRCALRREELKRTKDLIDRTRAPETADGADRIMERLRGERIGGSREPALEPRRGPVWRTMRVALAAAAVLALSAVAVFFGGREPAGEPAPVDQIFASAESLLGDVSRALADASRGMSAVPAHVANDARSAWQEIAAVTPEIPISDAVSLSERFLSGDLSGVSAAVKGLFAAPTTDL